MLSDTLLSQIISITNFELSIAQDQHKVMQDYQGYCGLVFTFFSCIPALLLSNDSFYHTKGQLHTSVIILCLANLMIIIVLKIYIQAD